MKPDPFHLWFRLWGRCKRKYLRYETHFAYSLHTKWTFESSLTWDVIRVIISKLRAVFELVKIMESYLKQGKNTCYKKYSKLILSWMNEIKCPHLRVCQAHKKSRRKRGCFATRRSRMTLWRKNLSGMVMFREWQTRGWGWRPPAPLYLQISIILRPFMNSALKLRRIVAL